ncbi:MAG: tRNA (cytidine(34)-2'-O)-methyltransferase [Acidobacteriota bacterium]|nr:tRNA (cytidine(34)-2'-O)-methyltransferase [Acidobacteriota bacterium]
MALDYDKGLNLVLVEPEIPGNTGAIGRLCVGLRATLTLIEPLGFSLEDKYLRRAGLDYWSYLEWQTLPDLQALYDLIADPKRFYYFTTKTQQPYTAARYKRGDLLLFGKETRGMSEDLLRANAERTYTIPMYGNIRSHNLAVSAGIVAYEAMRQITGGFSQS